MIQWFPGHMHKASKEFSKILPQLDLVIEVLDARLPGSSENPMLARLSRNKPGIKLLNKSDMSEAGAVEDWRQSLQTQSEVRCLPCSSLDQAINQLPSLCRAGLGFNVSANGPSPAPFKPWQDAQKV